MSTEPLIPQNTAIVVACGTENHAADAMANYGAEVAARVTMHVCITMLDAESAKGALPPDTPWTILGGAPPFVIASLQAYFGTPKNFAYALDARNQEFAVKPDLLRT